MAKKNSRTTNTIYNFTTSIGGQFLSMVMQFVVRTVFIRRLGGEYLGINGLFSNILQMLSLAEFGVGSAILYKLYEPIAKEDHDRIAILMKFYQQVYRVIGIAVAGIGVCLIPFLPKLIKNYDKLEHLGINAVLIFLLFLMKSVASYWFFAYKSAIVKANQQEYMLNLISYLFTVGAGIVQIIFLIIYPNFEVYVIILVAQVILQNFACARLSDKRFPYIKNKTKEKVSKDEVKGLFKDCSALFLYKMNTVVLKATDNIVISMFLGLDMVALYSNYYIFYTTISTLFNRIFNSVSHSLGNLHTGDDRDHEYKIFESVNLVTAILGGTAGVGIAVVSNEVVRAWIGDKWVISQPFAILMGIELFGAAVRLALSKYRTTMGLFRYAVFRPVAGMIVNLVVSVALVNVWGISGVLVGTIVADWAVIMWYDPIIIHRHGFDNYCSPSRYFIKLAKYLITIVAVGALDMFICGHFITGHGWITAIVHAVICAVTVPGALIAVSIRKPEGKYVFNLGMGYVRKFTKKIKKH